MKIYKAILSPIGTLYIVSDGDAIIALRFTEPSDIICGSDPLLDTAETQLQEYFAGTRKSFDLSVKLHGTEFQKLVWKDLCSIPYGETVSYKELASRIGNPKACRAVGMANNKNPIPIIIPCHRVIGANGSLTGYAFGLDAKKFLLDLEHNNK